MIPHILVDVGDKLKQFAIRNSQWASPRYANAITFYDGDLNPQSWLKSENFNPLACFICCSAKDKCNLTMAISLKFNLFVDNFNLSTRIVKLENFGT
jgi:hypothetical protein